MGDALVGVVDDDREVVGGADVLAGEDDVAERRRVGGVSAGVEGAGFGEGERTRESEGAAEIETDGVARPRVGHGATAAGAGIDRMRRVLLGCRESGTDIGARAAAGVGEAEGGQAGEGGGVAVEVVGLAEDGLGPDEAEPGEVGVDGGLVLGAGAGGVDVLDAEEAGALLHVRDIPGGQRREGVAEVERAGRRRGEAGAQVSRRAG